jgi:hypothetical protein
MALEADFDTKNAIYKKRIGERLKEQGLLSTLSNQLGKQYFRLFDIQTFFTTQFIGGARQAYTTESQALITFLKIYAYITYGFVLTAGVAGISFLKLRSVQWPHFFLFFILYNLGLFFILHSKTRYVLQIFPFLIFFASVTTYGIVSKIRRQEPSLEGFEFNRIRVLIAILSSILMGITMVQSLI